jgi:hypothetical protein
MDEKYNNGFDMGLLTYKLEFGVQVKLKNERLQKLCKEHNITSLEEKDNLPSEIVEILAEMKLLGELGCMDLRKNIGI